MSALHEIKHEARGRDSNKARGKAENFISIKAVLSALFSIKHEQGNVLTIFLEKCFDKNVLTGLL